MDWISVIGILTLFAVIFIPFFWLTHHFRGLIPNSGLRVPWESSKPKTKFEEIFGM